VALSKRTVSKGSNVSIGARERDKQIIRERCNEMRKLESAVRECIWYRRAICKNFGATKIEGDNSAGSVAKRNKGGKKERVAKLLKSMWSGNWREEIFDEHGRLSEHIFVLVLWKWL
jgi:hypothetical protein